MVAKKRSVTIAYIPNSPGIGRCRAKTFSDLLTNLLLLHFLSDHASCKINHVWRGEKSVALDERCFVHALSIARGVMKRGGEK